MNTPQTSTPKQQPKQPSKLDGQSRSEAEKKIPGANDLMGPKGDPVEGKR